MLDLTPNTVEVTLTLGAHFPRGGPVLDPVLALCLTLLPGVLCPFPIHTEEKDPNLVLQPSAWTRLLDINHEEGSYLRFMEFYNTQPWD
jgi:hypothetical protein